jgi:hypothetical protein
MKPYVSPYIEASRRRAQARLGRLKSKGRGESRSRSRSRSKTTQHREDEAMNSDDTKGGWNSSTKVNKYFDPTIKKNDLFRLEPKRRQSPRDTLNRQSDGPPSPDSVASDVFEELDMPLPQPPHRIVVQPPYIDIEKGKANRGEAVPAVDKDEASSSASPQRHHLFPRSPHMSDHAQSPQHHLRESRERTSRSTSPIDTRIVEEILSNDEINSNHDHKYKQDGHKTDKFDNILTSMATIMQAVSTIVAKQQIEGGVNRLPSYVSSSPRARSPRISSPRAVPVADEMKTSSSPMPLSAVPVRTEGAAITLEKPKAMIISNAHPRRMSTSSISKRIHEAAIGGIPTSDALQDRIQHRIVALEQAYNQATALLAKPQEHHIVTGADSNTFRIPSEHGVLDFNDNNKENLDASCRDFTYDTRGDSIVWGGVNQKEDGILMNSRRESIGLVQFDLDRQTGKVTLDDNPTTKDSSLKFFQGRVTSVGGAPPQSGHDEECQTFIESLQPGGIPNLQQKTHNHSVGAIGHVKPPPFLRTLIPSDSLRQKCYTYHNQFKTILQWHMQ